MRSPLLLLIMTTMCQRAFADVRFAGSVADSARTFDGTGMVEHGFGPGLAVDVLAHHTDSDLAYGAHLGWLTWDESDHNMAAHARQQLLLAHAFIEKPLSFGAIGMGGGLDYLHATNYDVAGNYSYTRNSPMLGVNLQAVVDLARTRAGMIGIVGSVGMFPLIDLGALLSGGEVTLDYHGFTGSVGVAAAF